MKKFITLVLALTVLAPTAALAMGSGDKFSDAQTGLTYSVYKPSTTLGLAAVTFSLLPCQPGKEQWLYAKYGGTKRYLEIMETMAGVKCSNPGLSKYLRVAAINGVNAKVYVYCDPMNAAAFKKCGVNDIARVGGYLMFTTKAVKPYKGAEIQVQGIGGITYAQLLTVAKGLKTVKASGKALPQVIAPVMIDPTTSTQVSVKLGNSVVLTVTDPAVWSSHILTDGILEFVPGGNQGTYTTNPAFKAVGVGTTVVHLLNSTDVTKVYELQITVTE